MSEFNMYRVTPRQARGMIMDVLEAGLVPFLQGSPGIGKSSIFKQIAKSVRLSMIDHRLSTSAPEDMTGLPHFDNNGMARFAPFADLFPLESTSVPDKCDGWLLFLDELNSASKSVQAAAYKLLLDRMVGQHRLHERVALAAAGNLVTDKAITNALGTAMQSRLIHLELEVSFQEWLEDVAIAENYDPRIIAFLSYDNTKLMNFNPNHENSTFECPRTWEFMNKLITGKRVTEEKSALYVGTISSGSAVEFIQFCKISDQMVKVADILRDPQNCMIPQDPSSRWMVICHMMSGIDEDNFMDLCTYANRFDLVFKVLFYRTAMLRHANLRRHPAFIKAMIELDHYLNDPVPVAA